VSDSEQMEDLRATAEDLIGDAERLKQIETQKLTLKPGDPLLTRLSEEASAIVARMRPKTQVQEELVANGEPA